MAAATGRPLATKPTQKTPFDNLTVGGVYFGHTTLCLCWVIGDPQDNKLAQSGYATLIKLVRVWEPNKQVTADK